MTQRISIPPPPSDAVSVLKPRIRKQSGRGRGKNAFKAPASSPGAPVERAVTLATIAEAVGVSRMTVSYALRSDGEVRLSPQTVQRVREAARRLNYVPNELARQLRQTRTNVVGVVFPDLTNDWADRVLRGMQSVFDTADYLPLLMTHRWSVNRGEQEVFSLLRRRVDALVIFPVPGLLNRIAPLLPSSLPLVLLADEPDDLPETIAGAACSVMWDAGPAAKAATAHLLDVGCRRPAFIGTDTRSRMTRARYSGFKQALGERGLSVDPTHLILDDTYDTAAMAEWLLARLADRSGPPMDGVLAMNDAIAADLLHRLHLAGYSLPRDLKLVGMGDLPIAGDEATGLTTVAEPCEALGREAAQLSLDLIHEEVTPPIRRLVPGSELFTRRTTVARGASRFYPPPLSVERE